MGLSFHEVFTPTPKKYETVLPWLQSAKARKEKSKGSPHRKLQGAYLEISLVLVGHCAYAQRGYPHHLIVSDINAYSQVVIFKIFSPPLLINIEVPTYALIL